MNTRAILARLVTESGEAVTFKRTDSGYDIVISGQVVGHNTVRRDWVKSSAKSMIRDKMANVWSISWEYDALAKALGAPREKCYDLFKPASRDIRRLNAGDIQPTLDRLAASKSA